MDSDALYILVLVAIAIAFICFIGNDASKSSFYENGVSVLRADIDKVTLKDGELTIIILDEFHAFSVGAEYKFCHGGSSVLITVTDVDYTENVLTPSGQRGEKVSG